MPSQAKWAFCAREPVSAELQCKKGLLKMKSLILCYHIVPGHGILGPGGYLPPQILAETLDHIEIY